MFYDLSLPVDAKDVQTFRERIATAIRLGYDCVAQTQTVDVSQLAKSTQLCPVAGQVSLASAMSAIPGVSWPSRSLQSRAGASSVAGATASVHSLSSSGARKDASSPADGTSGQGTAGLLQLSRLNVNIPDATHVSLLNSCPSLANFDLVAACAGSEKAFDAACTNLDVDIISFDMSQRLPFRMSAASVAAALARGIHFEICYGAALRGATERSQLFTNAQAILRATRRRGLLLSSGAARAQELRNPYDVTCIATLWGMDVRSARDLLSVAPRAVIARARARRAIQGVSISAVVPPPVHSFVADASVLTGNGSTPAADTQNPIAEARSSASECAIDGKDVVAGVPVDKPGKAAHAPASTHSLSQRQATPAGEGSGKNKKKRKRGRDKALAATVRVGVDDGPLPVPSVGQSGGPARLVAADVRDPLGATSSRGPGHPGGVAESRSIKAAPDSSGQQGGPSPVLASQSALGHKGGETSAPLTDTSHATISACSKGGHGLVFSTATVVEQESQQQAPSSRLLNLAPGIMARKVLSGQKTGKSNLASTPAKSQAADDFIEFD